MRVCYAVALVLLAGVQVGCGGGSQISYSAAATRQCLAEVADASVDSGGWDYISRTARGGSYRVNLGGDSVVLAFNGTVGAAGRMVAAYKAVAGGGSTGDILGQKGNVVWAWDAPPTSQESDSVMGCLTS